MGTVKVFTYKKTGAILREDAPLSIRTIERMVDSGDLERIGERMRRGISERSIIAYQQGERGKWGANAKKSQQDAANQEQVMLAKRRMAHGQAISQKRRMDTTSNVDSIPARVPRRGVIPS